MTLKGRILTLLWRLAHWAYNRLEDARPSGGWR